MKMRENLAHLTPQEKAERKRLLARERKRAFDARKKTERTKAVIPAELEAFADRVVTLPLELAALEMAVWAREHDRKFPLDDFDPVRAVLDENGYTAGQHVPADRCREIFWQAQRPEYQAMRKRYDRLGLIRLFSFNAIQQLQAANSLKKFRAKEKAEADALGLDLPAYRKQKRKLRRDAEMREKWRKINLRRNVRNVHRQIMGKVEQVSQN